MTDEQYIAAARRQYQSEGSIEIDEGAAVSRGDDPGAYVQAWVWVSSQCDDCGKSGDDCRCDEMDETERTAGE